MTKTAKNTIRIFELRHYLLLDAFYGPETTYTDTDREVTVPDENAANSNGVDLPDHVKKLVNTTATEMAEIERFLEFETRHESLPIGSDKYHFLICLWIMLGLPVYSDGKQGEKEQSFMNKPMKIYKIDGRRWCRNLHRHWMTDLYIKRKELKKFLSDIDYPLPADAFPNDKGNTSLANKRLQQQSSRRDNELQDEANRLAEKWFSDGQRNFTKEDIAKKLATSDKWNLMTSDRITRIIRVKW